jgi:hypothetical protein
VNEYDIKIRMDICLLHSPLCRYFNVWLWLVVIKQNMHYMHQTTRQNPLFAVGCFQYFNELLQKYVEIFKLPNLFSFGSP